MMSGTRVAEVVGKRLGRTILELGGNNAIVVTPSADMDLVLPAILFGAVGTAGQRCTSTRRIIVHESIKEELVTRLTGAYDGIRIGDPLAPDTLMGPLVTKNAVEDMMNALDRVTAEGGEILTGGKQLGGDDYPGGHYVTPCVAAAENSFSIVQEETFAPILYIIGYGKKGSSPKEAVAEMEDAMRIHNGVPQGLSSAIFTDSVREAEYFLSHRGSDCGIANVNIGTSGAEIGGAFGGEKETGGGRESGSDAWKAYMRRQTNTVNWSDELPGRPWPVWPGWRLEVVEGRQRVEPLDAFIGAPAQNETPPNTSNQFSPVHLYRPPTSRNRNLNPSPGRRENSSIFV
jgi:aldehyde dehydrogenase (NAD+)